MHPEARALAISRPGRARTLVRRSERLQLMSLACGRLPFLSACHGKRSDVDAKAWLGGNRGCWLGSSRRLLRWALEVRGTDGWRLSVVSQRPDLCTRLVCRQGFCFTGGVDKGRRNPILLLAGVIDLFLLRNALMTERTYF